MIVLKFFCKESIIEEREKSEEVRGQFDFSLFTIT